MSATRDQLLTQASLLCSRAVAEARFVSIVTPSIIPPCSPVLLLSHFLLNS